MKLNLTKDKLFKLENFVFLFCGFWCLFQIYFCTVKYLSFDFVTRINWFVPEKTPLPDLVLCFDFVSLINTSKLFKNYPEVVKKLGIKNEDEFAQLKRTSTAKIGTQLIPLLTIREITSILYTKDKLIDEIVVLNQTSRDDAKLCQNIGFFTSNTYCAKITCSYRHPISANVSYVDHLSENVPFFYVTVNTQYLTNESIYFVTLVKPNTFPWDHGMAWLSFDNYRGPSIYMISFTMYLEQKLPAPYQTQCYDYKVDGYIEQSQALNECLNRSFSNVLNSSFHHAIVRDNLDRHIDLKIFDPAFKYTLDKIVDKCVQRNSRPDCNNLNYPIVGYSRLNRRPRQNRTLIGLELIKEPVLLVYVEPYMTLSDLCIVIGSILGSWFGFSINYHVPLVCSTFYGKCMRYLTERSRQQRSSPPSHDIRVHSGRSKPTK
uniref:Uncharacterized protein n=1 Tax=Tetranychus urticae TaxID=32264 RepID=T1KB78_TETUR